MRPSTTLRSAQGEENFFVPSRKVLILSEVEGHTALVQYFVPYLGQRWMISPTTPRRKTRTQETKITPSITVTHEPNWAR